MINYEYAKKHDKYIFWKNKPFQTLRTSKSSRKGSMDSPILSSGSLKNQYFVKRKCLKNMKISIFKMWIGTPPNFDKK